MRYIVTVTKTMSCNILVEADSQNEAKEKAMDEDVLCDAEDSFEEDLTEVTNIESYEDGPIYRSDYNYDAREEDA